MIIAVAAAIFIWNFAVSPLVKLSVEMNSPLNIVEPFIAVINSKALSLIIPSVFLVLISDYPRIDRNSLFMLQRVNKNEWVIGQVIFFIFADITYLLFTFLSCILPLQTKAFFINGWSLVVTKYAFLFPDKASSFAATLITKELYNQMPPFESVMSSFLLAFMYLLFISMLLLLFYVVNIKKLGIVASVSIIAVGSALCIIKATGMWVFPAAHTMLYLHFTQYFKEPVLSIRTSFLYFAGLLIIIFILCLIFIKFTDFLTAEENDR
jgi:hypothetical protein